jgi:hypothetical protein
MDIFGIWLQSGATAKRRQAAALQKKGAPTDLERLILRENAD